MSFECTNAIQFCVNFTDIDSRKLLVEVNANARNLLDIHRRRQHIADRVRKEFEQALESPEEAFQSQRDDVEKALEHLESSINISIWTRCIKLSWDPKVVSPIFTTNNNNNTSWIGLQFGDFDENADAKFSCIGVQPLNSLAMQFAGTSVISKHFDEAHVKVEVPTKENVYYTIHTKFGHSSYNIEENYSHKLTNGTFWPVIGSYIYSDVAQNGNNSVMNGPSYVGFECFCFDVSPKDSVLYAGGKLTCMKDKLGYENCVENIKWVGKLNTASRQALLQGAINLIPNFGNREDSKLIQYVYEKAFEYSGEHVTFPTMNPNDFSNKRCHPRIDKFKNRYRSFYMVWCHVLWCNQAVIFWDKGIRWIFKPSYFVDLCIRELYVLRMPSYTYLSKFIEKWRSCMVYCQAFTYNWTCRKIKRYSSKMNFGLNKKLNNIGSFQIDNISKPITNPLSQQNIKPIIEISSLENVEKSVIFYNTKSSNYQLSNYTFDKKQLGATIVNNANKINNLLNTQLIVASMDLLQLQKEKVKEI